MLKKKHTMPQQLILGENDKKTHVFIQEKNRLKHTLVVGTKGSGKSTGLLPYLVKQDIEDKRVGATIIVGEKETALLLYALAKRAGRDVLIIKPSLTDSGKLLLSHQNYEYPKIQQDVVDYEKAIQKKQIVIVDMEFVLFQEQAVKGVAYLLTALFDALVRENENAAINHFLYVDDAYLYLPYMKKHLYYGKDYGLGCTLFIDSRLQLENESDRVLIDSTVRNQVLMSGLAVADAKYYVEDFYEKQIPLIRNRSRKEFLYSTLDKEGRRTGGNGKFQFLPEDLIQSLRMAVPRYRGGIEREQVGVEEKIFETPAVEPKTEPLVESQPEIANPIPVPEKAPEVKKAKALEIKPMRERVTEMVNRESKRHVVILDNMFDDDDEF